MSLTVNQFRYFVAVAQAGQISSAARDLFVSQSAVTTSVQEVERHLGQRLFLRTSRGMTLTEVGLALLPKAREILQLIDNVGHVVSADTSVVGTVRLGVSYTVMGYFVPFHLQQLSARFAGLKLELRELDRPTIQAEVLSGELDMGLLLASNVDEPRLTCETLVHSRRRLWLSHNHPLIKEERPSWADIARYPYALLTVDEADHTTRGYWGKPHPNVLVATSSIEAIRSIVANGNAVTVLSDMVHRPWSLEGRRIETRVLHEPVPDMTIGLAWRTGEEFTPVMQVLHDYFAQQFLVPAMGRNAV